MTTDTEALTYDHIVALALEHGFKLKPQVDGRMALNDYVIDFARAVYDIGYAAAKAETAAAVAQERERAAIVVDAKIGSVRKANPGRGGRINSAVALALEALRDCEDAIRAGAKEPSDADQA